MNDLQLTLRLIAALEQAIIAEDWGKVQQVDRYIAQFLTVLQGKPLSDALQCSLQQLEALHRQAYERCEWQSKELEKKMVMHRQQREGLTAYAMFTPDKVK